MKPKVRTDDLLIEELDDELVICDLERDQVHALNSPLARIWRLCDGSRSVEEIAVNLDPLTPPSLAEALVYKALDDLASRNLLDHDNTVYNRREVIANLGKLATLSSALVPVVLTLNSPPAHAQMSGCIPLGMSGCMAAEDCCGFDSGISCDEAGICVAPL